jgi:hypothetical protein
MTYIYTYIYIYSYLYVIRHTYIYILFILIAGHRNGVGYNFVIAHLATGFHDSR